MEHSLEYQVKAGYVSNDLERSLKGLKDGIMGSLGKGLVRKLFSEEVLRATIEKMFPDKVEEALDKFRNQYDLRPSESAEVRRLVASADDAYRQYLVEQNQFMGALVDIAQRDGLEKALTPEAEIEATRKVFPTKRDYIAHHQRIILAEKSYIKAADKSIIQRWKEEPILMKVVISTGLVFDRCSQGMLNYKYRKVPEQVLPNCYE